MELHPVEEYLGNAIHRGLKVGFNGLDSYIDKCKLVRAVRGEYPGDAAADGYVMDDGIRLNLSEKDQKWGTLVS